MEAQEKLDKDTAKKEAKAEAKADAALKKKMVCLAFSDMCHSADYERCRHHKYASILLILGKDFDRFAFRSRSSG